MYPNVAIALLEMLQNILHRTVTKIYFFHLGEVQGLGTIYYDYTDSINYK